ncbi:MAG: DUF4340 domain-containing protein [Cyclobacteriaceae bacterium]
MKIPKNYLLLGVLIVLVAISWMLDRSSDPNLGSQQAEKDLFAIKDPSLVNQIVLSSSEDSVILAQEAGIWQVNGRYPTDVSSLNLLLSVLQQVEVNRPIGRQLRDEWWDRLQDSGTKVSVFSNGELITTFIAGGDPAQSISYFADLDNQAIYQVRLPGYNTYLSEIFEKPENHWRDRRVFTTSWQTLDKISADHLSDPTQSFEILLEGTTYMVPGVNQIDTAKLFNFLDGITYLQLNQYVDTLVGGEPKLTVEVKDIDPLKSRKLIVYPLMENSTVYYCKLDNDWVTIGSDLIAPLLLKKSELVATE